MSLTRDQHRDAISRIIELHSDSLLAAIDNKMEESQKKIEEALRATEELLDEFD